MTLKDIYDVLKREAHTSRDSNSVAVQGFELRNSGGECIAFADDANTLGIFIPFGSEDKYKFRPDTSSKNIQITSAHVDGKRFAKLFLRNMMLEPVFFVFLEDLLKRLEPSKEESVTIAAHHLRRWRSLFMPQKNQGLNEEAEVGLLAELQTMMELLPIEGEEAFYKWTAANKEVHDFCFPNRHIECKATTSRQRLPATFHGPDQLEVPTGKRLLLSVRRYSYDPDSTMSVSSMVRRLLSTDCIPSDLFLEALDEIGFSLVNSGTEDERSYSLVEHHVFEVNDRFPRINIMGDKDYISSFSLTLNLNPPKMIPSYLPEGKLD